MLDYDYFKDKAYDIQPKNMEKRVRVFIEQLLPGMLESIHTVEDAWFMRQVLYRHQERFLPKLEGAQKQEVLMELDIWITKWRLILSSLEMQKEKLKQLRSRNDSQKI